MAASVGQGLSLFDEACSQLEALLAGDLRPQIVDELVAGADFRRALARLRDRMRSHIWTAGTTSVSIERSVKKFDAQTRREGFHVLNDWDGKADHVNPEIIPVDVLDYLAAVRGAEEVDRPALAILVDYYFAHVLALMALRAWDDGDPNTNLDRINRLMGHLHGAHGSGQPFVDDAATLILIATSHFEIHEPGYDTLLARVRTLTPAHQLRVALGHASSMGSHLRFGYQATYTRDTLKMRADNAADYPWLCYALATLMRAYAQSRDERSTPDPAVVEALLNGLTADAPAFTGSAPAILASCERERAEFRDRFHACRADLLEAFDAYRPTEARYSPISFFFNFSHNVLKGTVVDALIWGEPWPVSFDDLLTATAREAEDDERKRKLATTLMAYARSHPDRIGGRLMPVIVYDPDAGRQAFATTMRGLR